MIAQYIQSQFPSFYREEGPRFIQFVKTYYKWMEQPDNPLGKAESLPSLRDIDTTAEEFLVYFKDKYLQNIQLNAKTNTRLLVKNALDLHRSKGSERSIDLFFKLVYAANASVYYPGDDIFRLSSNSWIRPTFIELPFDTDAYKLVGKQITGATSKATAFAEKIIKRRNSYGDWHDLLYITDIVGQFSINEFLIAKGVTQDIRATVQGSLSTLTITDGGAGFSLGDEVMLTNYLSDSGRGVVTEVSNGSIVSVKVKGTGFAIKDGSYVNIWNENSTSDAIGIATNAALGFDPGYFKSFSGMLSSNQALFDGYYFQEYSYEIRSPLSFNKYSETLKNVLHVAGTQAFGSVVTDSEVQLPASITSSITQN